MSEHEHDHTSLEMAGGCAVGFTGTIKGYNADAEARFANALLSVGKWVVSETGTLLGHIKAAIVKEDGSGITLNLTDLENGVEHHGTLGPQEKVKFSFMTAVVDVDEHELKHAMWHAIEDTGLDYELDEPVCHCHDHEHNHHHHDDDECGCHGHHHHDDEECEISMTGTFTDVKAADVLSIIDSMDEVFEWVEERHGVMEYIEMTIAPEGADWVVISVPEKDFACIQGKLPACSKAFFRIEAVAQGVRCEDLIHRAFHAIEDTDIECSVNGDSHCTCHDSKCSCGCGCDHDE